MGEHEDMTDASTSESDPRPVTLGTHAANVVRAVPPDCFAAVMATGIVSISFHSILPVLSVVLFWIAAVSYAVLIVASAARIAMFGGLMRGELADPAHGFGHFTFVAGTDVIGSRLALAGHPAPAAVLLLVGAVGWVVLGYLVPWSALFGDARRPALAQACGSWFVWAVASQSVAVLAGSLEPMVGTGRVQLALLAVVAWSVGVVCYAAVGVVVAVRLLRYRPEPAEINPPYWVAMGATAITVLAGSEIVHMSYAPMLTATRGLVADGSVVFWAFGTWLIPPLVIAGWWRHVTHRVSLRYDAGWWSIVFPLGMYGAACAGLATADHLPIVGAIGRVDDWVALVAWAVVSAAMLAHLPRVWARRKSPARPATAGLRSP